jgi:hypothetical protein
MEVKEKRLIKPQIVSIMKIFKYKSYPIFLTGSAGLASQIYFSDYDFRSLIDVKKENVESAYNEIMDIIKRADRFNNIYFIEFKIQNKDGSKTKFFKQNDITLNKFKKAFGDIDFLKLDYIINIDNTFTEVSINYQFIDESNIVPALTIASEINKSRLELIKDGDFYKSLKRVLSILLILDEQRKLKDKSLLVEIARFLNNTGKLYQTNSNLKAIKLLLENYDDEETIKRVLLNLKDIKQEPNIDIINKNIKSNALIYNKEAEQFIKKNEKKLNKILSKI